MAKAEPSGISIGDSITLYASLTEYDVPVEKRARVWAEVTLPNQSKQSMALTEKSSGQFEASLAMTLSGLYTLRVRARGETLRGTAFEREQTLTVAAYPAGYVAPSGQEGQRPAICQILECLFGQDIWPERAKTTLKELGIDPDRLRKCLEEHCHEVTDATLERSSARRV
jgi:hypothetical protein